MQNRYVADIGDFGKYGLLRALANPTAVHSGFRLAVLWYLVPDESHNNDGKHVTYLERECPNAFEICDAPLFATLKGIYRTRRHVAEIQAAGLFDSSTNFYDKPLAYAAGDGLNSRRRERARWLSEALDSSHSAQLLFLDPDNGLESAVSRYARTGPKFVYYDDVERFCSRRKSLVVYHHTGRRGTAIQQVQRRIGELMERFGRTHEVDAVLYHRGSCRAYFMLIASDHFDVIDGRLDTFLRGHWSQHFDRCKPLRRRRTHQLSR